MGKDENRFEEFQVVLETIKDVGFEGVDVEYSLIPSELMREPEKFASIIKSLGIENGVVRIPG